MRTCLLLTTLFMPAFLFAQTDFDNAKKMKEGCDGKLFTKTEVLPGYKISKKAFQDSVTLYLKSNNASICNGVYAFIFVLNFNAEMEEFSSLRSIEDPEKTEQLISALRKYSYLLTPAVQNGRRVCSYVKLHISFIEGQPDVRITQ